jgi:hypothetical protein
VRRWLRLGRPQHPLVAGLPDGKENYIFAMPLIH